MPGPWEKYAQQGPPADPVIAPADPYKQANEGRAQEDQALQAEAAERARAQEARDRIKFDAEFNPDGTPKQNSANATEAQAKVNTLLTRIAGGFADIQGVTQKDASAQEPGVIETLRGDEGLMPGGIGGMVSRGAAGPARRTVYDSQRDVLDALLTLGTGAAYNAEQLSGTMASYFPQYNDTPEEITVKNNRMLRLIEAAKINAGPRWAEVESVIAPYMQTLSAPKDTPTGGAAEEAPPEGEELLGWRVNENGERAPVYGAPGSSVPDNPNYIPNPAIAAAAQEGPMGSLGLAGHGISLGMTDEASGVGYAIGAALTGDFDLDENYRLGRDTEQMRIDRAREQEGWLGTAAEFAGSGALGKVGNAFSLPMMAGRSVAASGAPVTRSAIQSGMARRVGAESAVAGGLGGFGYGRDEASIPNAIIGAGVGGLTGYGGQKLGNAFANRQPSASLTSGVEVQQAADALQIPVIPAVTGGTTARRLTGGARQGFISDRPIAGAVDRMEAAGGAARDRTAAATGPVRDSEDAGNVVRQAGNVYSKRTSQIGGNLYVRADKRAGGEKLPLPSAIQTADDELAQLAKAPGGTESALYKDIAKLKEQMGGAFEVDGIRAFRTRLRNEMTERGLRGTPQDVTYGRILKAAEDDMIAGLQAANKPEAAAALKTASAFWQKRVETIDEVLDPILGKNAPRSGEQIVTALENMANPKTGNAARLRGLFGAMPKDEAKSISATLISRMGQPTKGAAQNADEGGFSFNTFLTNWNNMSPRAKAIVFPKETREALNQLATVSRGVKQAGGTMNTSNTGGAIGVQAVISAPAFLFLEPVTAAITAISVTVGQWTAGRLLASPRIARWIASAPKNPAARKGHIAKLSSIARAEPALANEIGLLQRAANDNLDAGLRVVAEEQPEQE